MALSKLPSRAAGTWQSRLGLAPGGEPALPWVASRWFNHRGEPLQPATLLGRVVVLHAFQMLCPACVHHGLPQAQRIQAAFADEDVAVIGLHTVFEHHAAMTPVSLEAFLHENTSVFRWEWMPLRRTPPTRSRSPCDSTAFKVRLASC